MEAVEIKMPAELLSAIHVKKENASEEIRKIVALELFRERAVSIGKAAEIAGISLQDFMELSAKKEIPVHYTREDLEADRETTKRLEL